jgi:ketosteroid isomerase-like protein
MISQENLGIVRRLFQELEAGLKRGNIFGAVDAGLIHSDCVWIIPPDAPIPGTFYGLEGFEAFMRRWIEDFDDWSDRVESLIDAGEDRVLVVIRQRIVGKGNRTPLEWRQGQVYELEGGRVIRIRNYLRPAQAFKAAGLSE